MKRRAALLLVVILTITTGVLSDTTPTPAPPTSTKGPTVDPQPSDGSAPSLKPDGGSPPPPPTTPPSNGTKVLPHTDIQPRTDDGKMNSADPILPPLSWRVENMMNPQEVLLEEIRSLDEESTDEEIQKVLVKATKADAKNKPLPSPMSADKSSPLTTFKSNVQPDPKPSDLTPLKGVSYFNELMEDVDVNENEADDIAMTDDADWDDDDDDDDDEDDDEDDEDDEDDITDDEEILLEQNCPSGCRCSEQFAGVTAARCTEFGSGQTFGSEMTHLKIENAADVTLGPHSLREKELYQLRSIAVVDTRISTVDKTAFDGIPNLFSINLTRNGLLGLHPDTFQNNTQLNLLTLSGNPLQFSQGKKNQNSKYFLDAPNVSELDLSNNGITRLLPTTFARMPRLGYLSLRNNKIRNIEKTTFVPVDQLEELDLSNNQLNSLPAELFKSNEYLEILHISGNNLSTLATIRAPRLDSLDASKNKIKIIATNDLAGMPQLEKLYVRSNGLQQIYTSAFENLVDLLYLDISDNKLTYMDERQLWANSRLDVIIMNDNPGLPVLPVFKTKDGSFSVNRFECAGCGLRSLRVGTFDAMQAMTRLNLARNGLSSFPKGLLAKLSGLRELDLSDNKFTTIEVDMFQGARSLTKLSLAGNPIRTLQVAPFLLTPSLSRFDVSRCGLEKIWSGPIVPLDSLRFLSVRGNHIERIKVNELKATPKLSGLDISHNPFECSQDFNAVIQWLIDHGVSPTETLRYMSNYGDAEYYIEPEGLNKWTDLAKVICDSIEDGPPPRKAAVRPKIQKDVGPPLIDDLDELAKPFDHGMTDKGEQLGDAWMSEEQEYEEYAVVGANYRPWYAGTLWPVMTVILVTLAVVLFVVNFAIYLSKRRGRGPVIRAPMILRPGLIDNKNCGLVYKPLQEEIPTPQMAKRGSFYSSSTFHYDKIVPESV